MLMPLIRTEVAGDPVKLFVLPPATDKYRRKFAKFCGSDSVLGLDVETTSIDEALGSFDPNMRLRMVQFGNRTEAWCFDMEASSYSGWFAEAQALLGSESHRFVSHTNYDPLWVHREFGIELGERSIDTMPMAALLFPGQTARKDLKDLSDRFIDRGLTRAQAALHARFKELAPPGHRVGKKLNSWGFTNIPLDDEVYGQYGGLDAIYVRRLLDCLAALLTEAKMNRISKTEQRVARIATKMQTRGMRLDKDWTKNLLDDVSGKVLGSRERLEAAFGFPALSPKRGPWLQEHGVKFYEFTPTGLPVLDKDTMPNVLAQNKKNKEVRPILKDMVNLSEHQNLYNNLRQILAAADENGFVHPNIRTQAAHTGRMSIKTPAMQTFKKRDPRLRGCFISREHHVLVGADYDGQEIRIGARFSQDKNLLRIVSEGLSQHKLTAEMIFGADYTPKQYDAGKILDFAQQYGAGPLKIGDQLGMPRGPASDRYPGGTPNPEAVKMWKAWRQAYSGLVNWSARMGNLTEVINPFGRRIPKDKFRPYANGNYMIQSSGRDVLGAAMCELADYGWADFLWLPIHDELILEVPEDKANDAVEALKKHMYTDFGGMPLTVTAKVIGTRWGVDHD